MIEHLISRFLGARGFAIASFAIAVVASWSVAGTALAAPTNATPPSIASGTAQIGQTLTADKGVWTTTDAGGITGYSYSWTRGGVVVQAGPTATYAVTAADAGQDLAVTVSASDATGSTAASPVSAGVVPAPLPTPGPTIGPTVVQQGVLLTATPGGWSGTPAAFHYAWTSGGNPVGTDSSTYTPVAGDVGQTIAVAVTATYSGESVGPVSSAAVGPVLPPPPGNLTPPIISGTPQQGQVLSVMPGTWSNNPSLTEQWERCTAPTSCSAIPGATGLTYTVGADDVGHTIEVVETASNAAPPPTGVVTAASSQTATVSATSATSVVVFSQNSPNTNEAVTLVATVSSNSGNANPHGSLSFFNGSDAISGCANKGVSGGQTITIVCQASFGAGQAQVSAAYLADPTSLVAGSTSTTTSVGIGKGSTSMSLAVTPKVAPGGQATYVATLGVPLSSAGPILPNGSIQFLDGGQPISGCGSQALSNLTATCTVSYPSAGQHSITAHYDGDSNFTGSTSPASGVQIVAGAPRKPSVRGALGSTVGWTFKFHPHYSWPIQLRAYAVLKGTTILVQCFGKGCPFSRWQTHTTKAAAAINLQPHFGHHRLRAGDRITVSFTRKNWIGRTYTIRIRPGRKPMMTLVCLAPNKVHARVACPAT